MAKRRFQHEGRRLYFVVASALLAGLFSSCDSFPAANSLGITLTDGRPLIIYKGCPEESVAQVELLRQRGDSPWDGDDEVLWSVVAEASTDQTQFIIGDVPEGYRLKKDLDNPLPPDEELVAAVKTAADISVALGFSPDELREATVLASQGERLTADDFEQRATEDC